MGQNKQAKVQKEALLRAHSRRTFWLAVGDQPLVFGRVDLTDEGMFHIGRVGVNDEAGDRILVDWRAPVAECFYRATQSEAMGLRRRRHLVCRGQRVVALDDEVMGKPVLGNGLVLMGEAALMASMQRSRTGRMGDIVPTIQREQDAIIRSPLDKLLIVQGGPGTGKTVVALHRAAYLLYSYRQRLKGRSVLLVGPNPVFMRYIEDVLPSLGEHQVKLVTPGAVVEGITATRSDLPNRSRVMGDPRMVQLIAAAVGRLQRPLVKDVVVWHESMPLRISVDESARMIDTVRAKAQLHNPSRRLLQDLVLHHLYGRLREQSPDQGLPDSSAPMANGEGGVHPEVSAYFDALAEDPRVVATLEAMWPVKKARTLFRELFSSPPELEQACAGLFSGDEMRLLLREGGAQLSAEDVAILDEIDAQLGPLPTPAQVLDTDEHDEIKRELVRQALADLEYMVLDKDMKADVADVVERNFEEEFAPEDRTAELTTQEYSHIIVDEAQELSPMQWRMISRRCPSGSMTVVGDLGQSSGPWGVDSWDEVIEHFPQARESEVMTLSINYRTPSEVMDVASKMLRSSGVTIEPPRSVRSSGSLPRFVHSTASMRGEGLRSLLKDPQARADGKTAILVPGTLLDEILEALDDDLERNASEDVLDAPVAVFTVDEARGLEFDSVIIIEPAQIVAEHSNGIRALYVAMTRTTKQLHVLHSQPLPTELVASE